MRSPYSTFVFRNLVSIASHNEEEVIEASETHNDGPERSSEAHRPDRFPFLADDEHNGRIQCGFQVDSEMEIGEICAQPDLICSRIIVLYALNDLKYCWISSKFN